MNVFVLTHLYKRKVPIDSGLDRIVGGAYVSKNRNTVSAQYLDNERRTDELVSPQLLENNLTYNNEFVCDDRPQWSVPQF